MSGRFYTVRELAAMFGDPDAIAELFTRSPAVPEPADLTRQRAAGREAYERAWAARGVPQGAVRSAIYASALPWLYPGEASGGR